MTEVNNETEMLLAQQNTIYWDESKYLDIAPGQNNQPLNIIFDSYAEELSFPNIYYGTLRVIKMGIKATPFSFATSEIRRKDRRGVTSHHILYIAAKIMRFRVTYQLKCSFKMNANNANITRRMIEDKTYLDFCVDNNWLFYALFQIQLGKPTFFLTLSANEVRWPNLLKTLYKFSKNDNNTEITNPLKELTALQRATLVNNDPVICCMYFNKLVDCILRILSGNRNNPFGKFRIMDYFKRIEFQHMGSPHAHILIWLDNVPNEKINIIKMMIK